MSEREADRDGVRASAADGVDSDEATMKAGMSAVVARLDALDARIDRLADIVRSIERRVSPMEMDVVPAQLTPVVAPPSESDGRTVEPEPEPSAPSGTPADDQRNDDESSIDQRDGSVESGDWPIPTSFRDRIASIDRPVAWGSAPRPATRQWSAAEIERLASGRGLAWVGGLALTIGAIFFLSLAFSRGWIGPATRVGIGLVGGVAMITSGALVLERRDPLVGRVLVAVGIGVWNLALFAATRLYDLAPIAVGLGGALIGFAAAVAIAIRADAEELALFGVAAAIAAPPCSAPARPV